MNYIGFDTSSENLSISLKKNNQEFNFNREVKHSASSLVYFLNKIIKKNNIKPKDLDVLILGKGPGSFTGLRIGFSVAKALFLSWQIPIISLSSFLSIAYQLRNQYKKIGVISLARKGLFYFAGFGVENKRVKYLYKERIVNLSSVLAQYQEFTFLTYDDEVFSILKNYPQISLHPLKVFPKVKFFIPQALSLYKKKKFTSCDKLEPLYLFSEQCQIRKKNY